MFKSRCATVSEQGDGKAYVHVAYHGLSLILPLEAWARIAEDVSHAIVLYQHHKHLEAVEKAIGK